MTDILEVENLHVHYRTRVAGKRVVVRAVDGVSFCLEQGKTTGLVGESGSGKSTIARALVRLAPIQSGAIRFRGENIHDLSERSFRGMRKKMQMIFQDPYHSLNPRMTIGNLLEEPIQIHFAGLSTAQRRERAIELLQQVGLDQQAMQRYPHQFSGGQRQRIGIARAMSVRPDILICDEAVSALDVSVQAQIINLLQDLQDQLGFTCLFIGHDLAVIEHMSDHVLVMRQGRIIEAGTPEQIYQSPRMDYTKQLLDAVPCLDSLN